MQMMQCFNLGPVPTTVSRADSDEAMSEFRLQSLTLRNGYRVMIRGS